MDIFMILDEVMELPLGITERCVLSAMIHTKNTSADFISKHIRISKSSVYSALRVIKRCPEAAAMIPDSRFQIPDSTFHIPHSTFHNVESGILSPPLVPPLMVFPTPLSFTPPLIPPSLAHPRKKTPLNPRFDDFWSAYPRKTGKECARKAWAKINPDEPLAGIIIQAVGIASLDRSWRDDGGKFIPHPSTYLNQRRWEDEGTKLPAGSSDRPKLWTDEL